MTALDKAIWDRIDELIDAPPVNGINAAGDYSESVEYQQRAFVNGLRLGRLAARNVVRREQPIQ